MSEFREIRGRKGLVAYQSGAFGTPTHWVVARNGDFVCATNSEIDARLMLHLIGNAPEHMWLWARRQALNEMSKEAA